MPGGRLEIVRTRGPSPTGALARAEATGLFGPLTVSADLEYRGRFASFRLDPGAGALLNHRVGSDPACIERLSVTGLVGAEATGGWAPSLVSATSTLTARNDAEGSIEARTASGTIALRAAPTAVLSLEGRTVVLDCGGQRFRALLAGEGTLTMEPGGLRWEARPGGLVVERVEATTPIGAGLRHNALALGRLGAQVNVVAGRGEAVADAREFNLDVMRVATVRDQLEVRARASEEATSLLVRSDVETLPVASAGDLRVIVNGETALLVSGPEGVVAEAGTGDPPRAYVSIVDGKVEVLVSVAPGAGEAIVAIGPRGA